MLKIGEFSKLSRVSVRMLRYYGELGILTPVKTDPFTDYRYYSIDQLTAASRITALKDMGFSLSEISTLLEHYDDKELLDKYFKDMQKKLNMQLKDTKERLRLLDTARLRLRKEDTMEYNIVIKTFPERYAACVKKVIPHYEDEGLVWAILTEETADMNLIPDDPCLCCSVFFDNEYKERDVSLEIQKTVKGKYKDTENVKFKTLPPVTVASCTFKGSYDKIGDVYTAVISWVEKNGYKQSQEPMFNIFHISPHETDNPDEFVTEVCYPIMKNS